MSLFQSEYKFKVSFEELDPMNIVWHGNYMRYMEQARCDLFEKLKYSYNEMYNDGYAYPIAKMNVKYIRPASLGDIISVKSEIISIEPTLDIKYVMYNTKTDEKIFEASTMQIAVDMKTKQSLYTPHQNFKKAIEAFCNETTKNHN